MGKINQCTMWIVLGGLTILTGVNIYNYSTKNVAKELEVLQQGGIENHKNLTAAYQNTKYVEKQKTGLEGMKKQVEGMADQLAAMEKAEEAAKKAEELRLKPGKSVLDKLSQIKETNKFIAGPEDARFTILEYSELLCPFCKRHS